MRGIYALVLVKVSMERLIAGNFGNCHLLLAELVRRRSRCSRGFVNCVLNCCRSGRCLCARSFQVASSLGHCLYYCGVKTSGGCPCLLGRWWLPSALFAIDTFIADLNAH